MKKELSKTQAHQFIDDFFKRESFLPEEMKKIKRLAMKYKIRLGEKRKKFCKKCLSQLKGKTKITKSTKTVICDYCGSKNKFSLT